jgi:7-carboxy-7-deazaguanine synthase
MEFSSQTGFSHAESDRTRGDTNSPHLATLKISETFSSCQGEGKLTGTDSFFIRTSGCNLRCHFCDTPYASWNPTGDLRLIDDLVVMAIETGLKHVVLTGGEPMLPIQIIPLCDRLRDSGMHVTIETAGTIDRELVCDLASISPKLENSTPDSDKHPRWSKLHQQRRMPIDVMRSVIERSIDHQIKFVVTSLDDFAEIDDVVRQLRVDANAVWIMPEGVTIDAMDSAANWLKPHCDQIGYRYCDRMQIRWFGNRRGT